MVVLGVGLDQLNTAAFIKKLNLGVVIQDRYLLTPQYLIKSIEDVVHNQTYIENVKKISSIMRDTKDPREEFKYWLDFGYTHGYKSLVIDEYINGNWFSLNGFDVFAVFALIVFIFLYITIKFWKMVYNCMFGTCEKKKKRKNKID